MKPISKPISTRVNVLGRVFRPLVARDLGRVTEAVSARPVTKRIRERRSNLVSLSLSLSSLLPWLTDIVFYTSKTPQNQTNNEYSRRSRGGRPRRVLGRPAHKPQCTHTAPYQVIVSRGYRRQHDSGKGTTQQELEQTFTGTLPVLLMEMHHSRHPARMACCY